VTLGKLTSGRSKALKGTSSYELIVNGKKVVHVNPNHANKTVELVLEGEQPEQQASLSDSPPEQKEEGFNPQSDLIDKEGNYVLF
jgi:hypothetical protein